MNDRFTTTAGWVLFAGIVVLGTSIVSGEYFHAERPEKMGYPIEGVVLEGEGGAAAEKPIDFSVADAAAGEQVFKKCAACHNADKGGANQLGPNLWAVLGEPIGKGAKGFAFSEALASKAGEEPLARATPAEFPPLMSRRVREVELDWPDTDAHVDDELWPSNRAGVRRPNPDRVTVGLRGATNLLVPD